MSKRNRIKPLINTHDSLFKNSKVQDVLLILAVLVLLGFFLSLHYLFHGADNNNIIYSVIGNLVFAAAAYVAYYSCRYLFEKQTAIAAIPARIRSLFSSILSQIRHTISSLSLHGAGTIKMGDGERGAKSIQPPAFYWPTNGCIEDICIDLLYDENTPNEYLLNLLKYRFYDLDRHFYETRPTDVPHPLISVNRVSSLPHRDCSNANRRQLILQGNLASYKYMVFLL